MKTWWLKTLVYLKIVSCVYCIQRIDNVLKPDLQPAEKKQNISLVIDHQNVHGLQLPKVQQSEQSNNFSLFGQNIVSNNLDNQVNKPVHVDTEQIIQVNTSRNQLNQETFSEQATSRANKSSSLLNPDKEQNKTAIQEGYQEQQLNLINKTSNRTISNKTDTSKQIDQQLKLSQENAVLSKQSQVNQTHSQTGEQSGVNQTGVDDARVNHQDPAKLVGNKTVIQLSQSNKYKAEESQVSQSRTTVKQSNQSADVNQKQVSQNRTGVKQSNQSADVNQKQVSQSRTGVKQSNQSADVNQEQVSQSRTGVKQSNQSSDVNQEQVSQSRTTVKQSNQSSDVNQEQVSQSRTTVKQSNQSSDVNQENVSQSRTKVSQGNQSSDVSQEQIQVNQMRKSVREEVNLSSQINKTSPSYSNTKILQGQTNVQNNSNQDPFGTRLSVNQKINQLKTKSPSYDHINKETTSQPMNLGVYQSTRKPQISMMSKDETGSTTFKPISSSTTFTKFFGLPLANSMHQSTNRPSLESSTDQPYSVGTQSVDTSGSYYDFFRSTKVPDGIIDNDYLLQWDDTEEVTEDDGEEGEEDDRLWNENVNLDIDRNDGDGMTDDQMDAVNGEEDFDEETFNSVADKTGEFWDEPIYNKNPFIKDKFITKKLQPKSLNNNNSMMGFYSWVLCVTILLMIVFALFTQQRPRCGILTGRRRVVSSPRSVEEGKSLMKNIYT